MMTQFSPQEGKTSLADIDYKFPKDVYPVGRLDHDSEGLLILTNDKSINNKLLNPENKHKKTYIAQIEGIPSNDALIKLENGVHFSSKGKKYISKLARAKLISQPDWILERSKPVKENLEKSWIEITITEGKNRQVRKMTGAINHPTLRLIRSSIEELSVKGLNPGQVMEISKNTVYKKLKLSQ